MSGRWRNVGPMKPPAHFVSILWKYAESIDVNDEKKTLAAWPIFGRGFIAEKLEIDKPEALPLAG